MGGTHEQRYLSEYIKSIYHCWHLLNVFLVPVLCTLSFTCKGRIINTEGIGRDTLNCPEGHKRAWPERRKGNPKSLVKMKSWTRTAWTSSSIPDSTGTGVNPKGNPLHHHLQLQTPSEVVWIQIFRGMKLIQAGGGGKSLFL